MKKILIVIITAMMMFGLMACDIYSAAENDIQDQKNVTNEMVSSQKTPTDINYSLERYNLIRRAYWVNGQREKANTLVCEIEKPLGYIVLFTDNGAVVGKFIVDGKVTSLNSYLTPDTTMCLNSEYAEWLADVDGSYGENDDGIFFFTTDGKYVEWTGKYLYSDIPMEISEPVIKFENQ